MAAKGKNVNTEEEKQEWRFFRSHLSTIVWDPDGNRPLADFSEGHFTTDKQKVADKLRELGYPEIPLDATEPPDIMVREMSPSINGDVPILGSSISPALAEKKMAERMAPTSPAKPAPKAPMARVRSV